MYPTCAVPGCAAPFHTCAVHHIGFWTRDQGDTDLGTQAPLCRVHHDDVHAARIRITMDPVTREVHAYDRHGTLLAHSTGPPGRGRAP